MASKFQRYATPDPEEFTFYVIVPDKVINESLTLLPGNTLRRQVTTYKQFAWAVSHEQVLDGYADYVYIASENIRQDEKAFYFAYVRTVDEMGTPFETIWSTQRHTWDAVLEQLFFLKVPTTVFPQVVGNGTAVYSTARYFERRKYRPSFTVSSRIKIEQFLSERPWDGRIVTHMQPVPTEINGTYMGLNVSYPKCLHPLVQLEELLPSPQLVFNAGTIDNMPSGVPRFQIFPATNFLTNRKFVISDVVQPVKGMFLREKVTIYPPINLEAQEAG